MSDLKTLSEKYGDDFEDGVLLAGNIRDHVNELENGLVELPQRQWDCAWEILEREHSGTMAGQRIRAFMEFLSVVRETVPGIEVIDE